MIETGVYMKSSDYHRNGKEEIGFSWKWKAKDRYRMVSSGR